METYLVGGAIRDELLGLPVHEYDYVVVGATAAEMRAQGYRQVGRDFPVFLHPRTGAEYALARTERKSGPGHRGFEVQADPDVTLEDDLRRRDLTINAMARASDGTLIDPYGGQRDLAARVLRHLSPAFAEDPLRILRVARFAARLAPLGFSVAQETQALMHDMVAAGMLTELPPERIWREWEKALEQAAPGAFFDVLEACGARAVLWPELPWPDQERPVWRHFLDFLAAQAAGAPLRYAGLWLAAAVSVSVHAGIVSRYRVPARFADLADLALRALPTLPAGGATDRWLSFLEQADALRRPARFEEFLDVLAIWERFTDHPAPRSTQLRAALEAVRAVSSEPLRQTGLAGPEFGRSLRQMRLNTLQALFEHSPPAS